jgi:hypothetical protein
MAKHTETIRWMPIEKYHPLCPDELVLVSAGSASANPIAFATLSNGWWRPQFSEGAYMGAKYFARVNLPAALRADHAETM